MTAFCFQLRLQLAHLSLLLEPLVHYILVESLYLPFALLDLLPHVSPLSLLPARLPLQFIRRSGKLPLQSLHRLLAFLLTQLTNAVQFLHLSLVLAFQLTDQLLLSLSLLFPLGCLAAVQLLERGLELALRV